MWNYCNLAKTLETCHSILGINPSQSHIYSWYWHKLSLSVPDLHKNSKETKQLQSCETPSLKLGWGFLWWGGGVACLLVSPPNKIIHFFGQFVCATSGTVASTLWLNLRMITIMEHCIVFPIFFGNSEGSRKILQEHAHYFNQKPYLLQRNTEKILILISSPRDNQLLSLKWKAVGLQNLYMIIN